MSPGIPRETVIETRQRHGKRQREMAELAGVTLRSYQRWEAEGSTHRSPHRDTWTKVLRALGEAE